LLAPGQRENITLAMGLQLKNGDVIYCEPKNDDTTDSLLMEKFKLLAFQISYGAPTNQPITMSFPHFLTFAWS
jgi:hypothetical protein